jgi:hypothetical protein
MTLLLFTTLATTTPVFARGRLGHRVTSRLTERNLTPKAKTEVQALLEPGESLADASLWADEHRRELPKTEEGCIRAAETRNRLQTGWAGRADTISLN